MGNAVNRIAPKDGYKFSAKEHYRRNVWNCFKLHCHQRMDSSRCLLMPSSEGIEIEVALRKGFRQRNLIIVDRNPAIVATLKRKYPLVDAYGVDVDRAAERVAKKHTIRCANLDLCNKSGPKLYETLTAFIQSGVIKTGLVGVTMLRGREVGETGKYLTSAEKTLWTEALAPGVARGPWAAPKDVALLNSDEARMAIASAALRGLPLRPDGLPEHIRPFIDPHPYSVAISRAGIYKSTAGNQTMLWTINKVHRQPCCCDFCFAMFCSVRGWLPEMRRYDAYHGWVREVYGVNLHDLIEGYSAETDHRITLDQARSRLGIAEASSHR